MISESPLDARLFWGREGLNFINFLQKSPKMPTFYRLGKALLRPPRHMTFYNTLFNMTKSIQYFESRCLKSYVLFSLMG